MADLSKWVEPMKKSLQELREEEAATEAEIEEVTQKLRAKLSTTREQRRAIEGTLIKVGAIEPPPKAEPRRNGHSGNGGTPETPVEELRRLAGKPTMDAVEKYLRENGTATSSIAVDKLDVERTLVNYAFRALYADGLTEKAGKDGNAQRWRWIGDVEMTDRMRDALEAIKKLGGEAFTPDIVKVTNTGVDKHLAKLEAAGLLESQLVSPEGQKGMAKRWRVTEDEVAHA